MADHAIVETKTGGGNALPASERCELAETDTSLHSHVSAL